MTFQFYSWDPEQWRKLSHFQKIEGLIDLKRPALFHQHLYPLWEALNSLPEIGSVTVDGSSDEVCFSHEGNLCQKDQENVEAVLESFKPWRKGPFNIFNIKIDAEWQSNKKWDRLKQAIPNLEGKRVLDVGCNNGYYLYRLLALQPELVLGIDPFPRYWFYHTLFQRIAFQKKLQFLPFGVEHVHYFENSFNLILCMGILYHNIDPLGALRKMHGALKKGGTLLIECQTIEGEGSFCLFPEERYAKVSGTWFVPTKDCLINWLKRSGYREVECISHEVLTMEEQRKTPWMEFESLEDFLDPNDSSRTIEGYPAPMRTIVVGKKTFETPYSFEF